MTRTAQPGRRATVLTATGVVFALCACKGSMSTSAASDASVDAAADASIDGAAAGCGDDSCAGGETECTCPEDCGACAGCCAGDLCSAGDVGSGCGVGGEVCVECTGGEECAAGECACTANHHTECNDDDAYWFDSCGNLLELAEECGQRGCAGGECRTYTCVTSCRNGSEECDDEGFAVTAASMLLVCIDGNGGIGFIATNSGPTCSQDQGCCPDSAGVDCPTDQRLFNEGNSRCQGWETCGCAGQICPCGHAWDPGNQDKVASVECTAAGQFLEVDLSAYVGGNLYMGVHDNPSGGGHMNEVCVATWD